ncbi:MAG TPA: Rid family detoxifying hydrolase [Planctomycetota bacterium]|nr:Rid family detoxifying hydrolase [Planctomycetota bacterium]
MRRSFALALALLGAACATDSHVVRTAGAPAPIGPYSQAIARGEFVFVSGQIGLDPRRAELVPGGLAAETERALANVRAVLEAEHLDFEDVVQVQVFLVDLSEFQAFNAVYAKVLGACAPARATVQVAALPKGARVELVCTAMRR